MVRIQFRSGTSVAEFQIPNGNQVSDLSAKRNPGLMLARLHAWQQIALVDDDITL